jgi:phage tail sheath gpL-like
MSTIVLVISHPKDQAYATDNIKRKIDIANLGQALADGVLTGAVTDLHTSASNPVQASGTFTLVSAIATDAITIGTVTLTASSNPANQDEWEIDGASDALDAASLAAAINAHSVLGKVVVATSNSNVVTVKALIRGSIGNQIPISSADATITASGSFLTGGTGGAESAAQAIEA